MEHQANPLWWRCGLVLHGGHGTTRVGNCSVGAVGGIAELKAGGRAPVRVAAEHIGPGLAIEFKFSFGWETAPSWAARSEVWHVVSLGHASLPEEVRRKASAATLLPAPPSP
jgi:hypothetical protein